MASKKPSDVIYRHSRLTVYRDSGRLIADFRKEQENEIDAGHRA